ncbi:Zn-dependent oligopeptidase [Candidatus Dependentiae bacterium]|nr:Zn-dependent oligopeptidase [Candidatus Dependentiae bacterium]
MKLMILIVSCILIVFAALYAKRSSDSSHTRSSINCVDHIEALFPHTKEAVEERVKKTEQNVQRKLEKLYSYKPDQRTFANTMEALDVMIEMVMVTASSLEVLSMVSPDAELRDACRQGSMRMSGFIVDFLSLNPRLYQACLEYESLLQDPLCKEQLNDVQRYFVTQTMKEMRRNGLELPVNKQDEVRKIKRQLDEVLLAFDKNIADDKRFLEVPLEGLKGLDEGFIGSLQKTPSGLYRLGTDDPTYLKILDDCAVEQTRMMLYKEYSQKGYPSNDEVLSRMISLRDQLAHLLGYSSYAEYDIDDQMAKTPQAVKAFLADIGERVKAKTSQEMQLLKENLPEGVSLSPEGLIYPWNLRYMQSAYKKSHVELDEQLVSEYFPLEYSLESLLKVYERFFGLSFRPVECSHLWHKEVRCLAAYKGGHYYGTVILDLFPRANKFTHAAQVGIVPSVKTSPRGTLFPAVVFVIANFPRARGDHPALLTRKDLTTFFHEFGHAIHSLLGSTELASFSGAHVKGDFVEMPSQMLEEWLTDPQILTMVSKHYKTGKPLPEDLIKKIENAKNLFSGDQITKMIFGSYVSLGYFLSPGEEDVARVWKEYYKKCFPYLHYDEDNKGYAAFLHLPSYGAKYYGYLWSKVYAKDLFYTIKQHGLLNNAIGERYSAQVIGKGGSKDPQELLKTFLGREPNSDAFFADLGLEAKKESSD